MISWSPYLVFVPGVWLGLSGVPAMQAGADAPSPGVKDLPATVRRLPANVLEPIQGSASSAQFIETYYQSILQWGRIVEEKVQPVPGHPDWRTIGLPRHIEDHVRPTAYAAMVLGFLAEFQPPRLALDKIQRQAMRSATIGLLRYLTTSHITGGGTCLNGSSWGNQWQSAMWARAAGMAAWLVWPHLDRELREKASRMVESEADRFLRQAPKSSARNDTGAEENAWNASILALACNLMPAHPRARAWDEAAKRYMYNTFSVRSDAQDRTPGDNNRPIRDWVTTVNAHDDFTVENHGMVHVGYLKNAASELQENAIHWLAAGQPIPKACHHHIPEVFQVLISCMGWDGAPIYFGGNDWKLCHTQSTDVILYAMIHLFAKDSRAAHLERIALDHLRKQQQVESGYYNVRRDLEYGGLCATRLITCCLAHVIAGKTQSPVSPAEFDRIVSGVKHLASARTVLHRTPSKFASFTWGQKRMALALPHDGSWVVWPHFASYLGMINGEDSSDRRAELKNFKIDLDSDGFTVRGTLLRCRGKLAQDFFYASPPGDFTVYVECLRPQKDFRLDSRETGVIGLEYDLGKNTRALHGDFGTLEVMGYGGEVKTHQLKCNWLNIDNRIGYVICRSDGPLNIIRYHDKDAGSGRVPKLQEWLSLVGEFPPSLPSDRNWACVVTGLNQDAQETARWSRQVQFVVNGNWATVKFGKISVTAELLKVAEK